MEGTEKPGLSAAVLKVIACITMIIDHVGATLIRRMVLTYGYEGSIFGIRIDWYDTYYLIRGIGRLSFPLFCFLAVESFLYTRSVAGYVINLFILGLVSEIPFNLAMEDKLLEIGTDFAVTGDLAGTSQNVLFTISCSVLILYILKRISEKEEWSRAYDKLIYLCAPLCGGFAVYLVYDSDLAKPLKLQPESIQFWLTAVFAAMASLVLVMMTGHMIDRKLKIVCSVSFIVIFTGFVCLERLETDYGGWGLIVICIMYLLRKDRFMAFAAGCAVLTVMHFLEGYAFISLIPVMFYNGRRGHQNKYLFYSVYPVHLLALALICRLVGL